MRSSHHPRPSETWSRYGRCQHGSLVQRSGSIRCHTAELPGSPPSGVTGKPCTLDSPQILLHTHPKMPRKWSVSRGLPSSLCDKTTRGKVGCRSLTPGGHPGGAHLREPGPQEPLLLQCSSRASASEIQHCEGC